MIVWQQGGNRLFFDVTVKRNEAHIDAVRREMSREMVNENVSLDLEGDTVFLRGTVPDLTSAGRALAIATVLASRSANGMADFARSGIRHHRMGRPGGRRDAELQ